MTDKRPLRWRGTVRLRATIGATVISAVALIAVSAALVITLDHRLTSNEDRVSRAQADEIAADVQAGTLQPVITSVGDDSLAQVVTADGRVLAASTGLAGQGPISATSATPGHPELIVMGPVPDDGDTEEYRVWLVSATAAEGPVTIFVGASRESVSEAVTSLRSALLVTIPALLAVLAVGTWLLIGRALRPVEDIRTEVDEISTADLHRRVPVPSTDDEIERLAETMNAMLARLEAGNRREREFVSDASHELQSPLAAIRVQLEVAAAHPDQTDWPALADDLLGDSDRMERLVRDLLDLARFDAADSTGAATTTARAEALDLDGIVMEEVARLRGRPGIAIDTGAVTATPCRGSRDELARVARNLLENAVTHATTKVVVTCAANPGESDGAARLVVCDDGPGIAVADRERVFERFVRLDDARSHDGSGTGLGLAIARSIVTRHGGSIAVADPPDAGGACVVVLLPPA